MVVPGKRVLLVDDDEVRELLALALRSEGYVVDTAASAARALLSLTTSQYDLVIADWRLPDGDGTLVANFAEQLGTKILVISGYLFHMPRDRFDERRMLMKPLRPSELVAAVRESIGAPGADRV
jgi:two-component system, NtrC family, response regulator HydG